MPLKLIITRPAYEDMQNIFEYIAQDNKIAAKKLLEIFKDKFNNITKFPKIGYKPKFSKRNIRICIVAKHYQIVYSKINEKIFIQRVLTGYQDICDL